MALFTKHILTLSFFICHKYTREWPLSNTSKHPKDFFGFWFSISLRYMQKVLKTCGRLGSNVAHPKYVRKYSKPTRKRHYSIWSSMVAIQYSYILVDFWHSLMHNISFVWQSSPRPDLKFIEDIKSEAKGEKNLKKTIDFIYSLR